MAEYMLVQASRFLVPLTTLSPKDAAPITDAGLTPYHAIKRSLPLLTPRASVVVIGVGGLGHMGVQILRALTSSQIIAVDIAEDKLAFAEELGADVTVMSDENAPAKIAEVTRGQGAEAVIDFVGADATMALAAKVGHKAGHITIVGLAMGTLPFNFFALPYECAIAAPYWGTLPELIELIALAESGRIKSQNTYYTLDTAAEAYQAMREGKIRGRAVIVPNG
jgi:propanol-preferring alcohol dehydrogenase